MCMCVLVVRVVHLCMHSKWNDDFPIDTTTHLVLMKQITREKNKISMFRVGYKSQKHKSTLALGIMNHSQVQRVSEWVSEWPNGATTSKQALIHSPVRSTSSKAANESACRTGDLSWKPRWLSVEMRMRKISSSILLKCLIGGDYSKIKPGWMNVVHSKSLSTRSLEFGERKKGSGNNDSGRDIATLEGCPRVASAWKGGRCFDYFCNFRPKFQTNISQFKE